MTDAEVRALRHVVTRDGVSLMFGQRLFNHNQQAVVKVTDGFDAAHKALLELERESGLVDD